MLTGFFLPLILIFFLGVVSSSPSFAKGKLVSLNVKNVSIVKALDLIQGAGNMKLIYSPDEIDHSKKVSLNLTGVTAQDAVREVVKGSNLRVIVDEDRVIITKEEASTNTSSRFQKKIKGVVRDKSGNPIPGVNVTIKGNSTGVATSADGEFSIEGKVGDIVSFSFIGYKPTEVAAKSTDNLVVTLFEDVRTIDEVVVVGYGTSSKKDLASSVSTVKMSDVAKLPVPSLNDALGGRTQGIIVTNSGGGPGKKAEISIRGGGEPIFVIDGIIRSKNDYNNLNPNDIESCSILKDASATAIYGARAGDGIIVVTTKKGSVGKASFDFSVNRMWSRPTINPKKINSYERALLVNEMNKNENQPITYSDEVLGYYRDQTKPFDYPYVDWRGLCLKDSAPEARYDMSASGGNAQTKYYVGLSAYQQGTILRTDHQSLGRYTYRLNVVNDFKDLGLKMTAGLDGFIENQEQPNSGYGYGNNVWSHIQNMKPWIGAYNDKGLYLLSTTDHPLVELDSRSGYGRDQSRVFNGLLNFELDIPYVKGLKFKSNNSYNVWNSANKSWNVTAPQSAMGSTIPMISNNPTLSKSWGEGSSYTIQEMLDYQGNIGKNSFAAMLGYEQNEGSSSDLYAKRIQYRIMFDQFNAGPIDDMDNGSGEAESARAGFFGRLKYSYDSKYLLESTFRYDGSDKFPSSKRWGFFYAGNAAWVLTKEDFFRSLVSEDLLSELKFRVSYGVVGLDNSVGRFEYVPGYSINGMAYMIDGALRQGFSEGDLVSKDITWYSRKSLNYGVDAALFNNSLTFSLDYFYYRTTGYVTSPSEVGYTDPLGKNLPKVNSPDGAHRRAGTEFSLSYKNHIGDLEYSVGGNFTYFDQLWEVKPDEDMSVRKNPYKRESQRTGYSNIAYYNEGLYVNSDDVMSSPKRNGSTNITAGDIKYMDFNGDGKIDGNDQVPIGSDGFPRINYGISVDLSYKGAFANMLFRGSGNRDFYLGDTQMGSHDTRVIYEYQKDYWTPSNRNAQFPRLTSNNGINGSNNFVTSDYWVVNGRYFRLSSLQIGYDFKYALLKNVKGINGCTLVLSGTNLFTISKALDYYMDPETGSSNNYDYPVQQTYSLGLRLSF